VPPELAQLDVKLAGGSDPVILPFLLALTVPVTAWALLKARKDYHRRGKLSRTGLFSLCVMLLLPNLMLEYATTYHFPTAPLGIMGMTVALLGLALCLAGVSAFRSGSKVLCLKAGKLTVSGPYRWSRNPQYLGWILFLLGFALNDWSLWCMAALIVVATSLHLLVLIEEEHLRRVFGEPYRDFCGRVPRYL
jgi:protein-S-isoprenylcysteine O-methyltransferase Ste14